MSRELKNADLNLLVVFKALAEESHLTKAAEKLHMSQPAVSNALSRLRELFDDELFVRAPKGMRPTSKAASLKAPITEALHIIQGQLATNDIFNIATAKNHFAISINGYAEFVSLPDMLRFARKEAPNIHLEILPESDLNTPELLRAGEIDLAIDYIPVSGKDFIQEHFFSEELVAIADKNNTRLCDGLDIQQYRELPHVAVRPRDHRGSHIEILLGRKKIKRQVVLSVSNLISIPAIIADSDMIATVPVRLANYFSSIFPIVSYQLPFEIDPVPISMFYHKEKTNDPAHKWLRKLFREFASKHEHKKGH